MLNLSIMPLDTDHIDEICADIIEQQKSGVSTHAMMIMYFSPQGTPPINRAAQYCQKYDLFREKLDPAGAKYGVLVQSTLGHISIPALPHPFQNVVSLVDGSELKSTCCPLDQGFQKYIRGQMHTLATHSPSVVMIDDDVGLVYRDVKGCACPLHMAEFNRRAGTQMTREELYAHTQGNTEEDKRYTEIYVQLQSDALCQAVRSMRAGIDEVDPSILGVVSGIYTGGFCEFSDRISEAFAGASNPRIVRMNNGMYTAAGARFFTVNMYRAAILKAHLHGKADIFLAETDTCPQNRYSTSAALLHAHFTGTILEGATGAKHWITRLHANEPNAGKAYRKQLAQYHGFYEKLTEYAKELKPFGCRMPLSLKQDYRFVPSESGIWMSPWSSCVLERLGLPLYFSNERGGAVFLDDLSVDGFTDDEIKAFFEGTIVLSAVAAKKLNARGFGKYTGVALAEWHGKQISGEIVNGHHIARQPGLYELIPQADTVEVLSYNYHKPDANTEEPLFPAVTGYQNPSGGYSVVFCGTPDTPFHYAKAFSMLNETRKQQLIEILSRNGDLPVYYPEDAEVYLRAGYLDNGEMLCAFFNLSLDPSDEIVLQSSSSVRSVEMLGADGTRVPCRFRQEADGKITVDEPALTLAPVILFIQTN